MPTQDPRDVYFPNVLLPSQNFLDPAKVQEAFRLAYSLIYKQQNRIAELEANIQGGSPDAAEQTIGIKNGLAISWTTFNPILAKGELGIEIDTLLAKVGDGVTHWNELPYFVNTSNQSLISILALSGYPNDTTVFLRGDGTWAVVPSSSLSRNSVSFSTGSLADNATESGQFDLGHKSGIIYRVTVSVKSRVRFYSTAAGRTVDLLRSSSTKPDWNVGLLLELVLDDPSILDFIMQPSAICINEDDPSPLTTIYYNITNLSGGTTAIDVTVNRIELES